MSGRGLWEVPLQEIMRDVQYPNPEEADAEGEEHDLTSMATAKAETMKKILQSMKECIVKSTFS